MKRLYSICLAMLIGQMYAQTTPQTISMDPATSIGAAFGANGTLGTYTATFYTHWDATYLYLGWSNGTTNYSSDMYYVGIDVIAGQGSNGAIEGVGFSDAVHDFYVVFENNSSYYGLPATNGNAFEVYQDNGANGWTFVSRTGGDDGTSSQINFAPSPNGEVRLRIAWATLGVSPGSTQQLGLTFWTNNGPGNFMWSSWPNNNPAGGSTPQTLTHKVQYLSTATGTNPSSDGVPISLATTLPVELFDFNAEGNPGGVMLNWTAFEEAFSHYEVQRKVNDEAFVSIGRVDLLGEQGQINAYQYLDQTAPADTRLLYRLAMIDIDGTVSYSNQIELIGSTQRDIVVSPNPANGPLTVTFPYRTDGSAELSVYDLRGQLVYWKQVEQALYNHQVDLTSLPAGMYQMEVWWNGQRSWKKISLQ